MSLPHDLPMPKPGSTVVIGMSGGVDSSVAALLLKQEGYRVIGLFMKNWEELDPEGVCQSSKEFADVVKVCNQIGIPYYSVDFVEEYRKSVFEQFLAEFKLGHTPNPDILCNREIKFKTLLNYALKLGADFLATGHYCQVLFKGACCELYKGKDPGKDQSYFLSAVDAGALSKVLFPIGHLAKREVRAIARSHGLATSEKRDSTGICFIGKRDFKTFLSQYIQYQPGNFETVEGRVVGRHDGVAFYTPGQRHGIGLGGPGEAWFVIGKEIASNVVIIGQGRLHPALFCDSCTAEELNWLGAPPAELPFSCRAKVRYRQPDQACVIESISNGKANVRFQIPQRAVTPRQAIVFYAEERCLGGGMIEAAGPSYYHQGKALPDEVAP